MVQCSAFRVVLSPVSRLAQSLGCHPKHVTLDSLGTLEFCHQEKLESSTGNNHVPWDPTHKREHRALPALGPFTHVSGSRRPSSAPAGVKSSVRTATRKANPHSCAVPPPTKGNSQKQRRSLNCSLPMTNKGHHKL